MMAGEPWHTPCCGRCTDAVDHVDLPDSALPRLLTTPLKQHFRELRNLVQETLRILEELMLLYRSHFGESLLRLLESRPSHTGMPSIPTPTGEYWNSVTPAITQDIYYQLSVIAAFLERAIMEETSDEFLEALNNFEHAIYSLLCKIKVMTEEHGITLRSRVRRSVVGSTLIGLSAVAKMRARDYLVLRDAKKLLLQVILPELDAVIRKL